MTKPRHMRFHKVEASIAAAEARADALVAQALAATAEARERAAAADLRTFRAGVVAEIASALDLCHELDIPTPQR